MPLISDDEKNIIMDRVYPMSETVVSFFYKLNSRQKEIVRQAQNDALVNYRSDSGFSFVADYFLILGGLLPGWSDDCSDSIRLLSDSAALSPKLSARQVSTLKDLLTEMPKKNLQLYLLKCVFGFDDLMTAQILNLSADSQLSKAKSIARFVARHESEFMDLFQSAIPERFFKRNEQHVFLHDNLPLLIALNLPPDELFEGLGHKKISGKSAVGYLLSGAVIAGLLFGITAYLQHLMTAPDTENEVVSETITEQEEPAQEQSEPMEPQTEVLEHLNQMDAPWKEAYLKFIGQNDISVRYGLMEADPVPILYAKYPSLIYRVAITDERSGTITDTLSGQISVDDQNRIIALTPDKKDARILNGSIYRIENGKFVPGYKFRRILKGLDITDNTFYVADDEYTQAYSYDDFKDMVRNYYNFDNSLEFDYGLEGENPEEMTQKLISFQNAE